MHNNKYNNFINNHIDICKTCFFIFFFLKNKVLCKCNAHDETERVHISFLHVNRHMLTDDKIQGKMAQSKMNDNDFLIPMRIHMTKSQKFSIKICYILGFV
jgi:hypothetical protein